VLVIRRHAGLGLLVVVMVAGCGPTPATPSQSAISAIGLTASAAPSSPPPSTTPSATPGSTPTPTPLAAPTPRATQLPWQSYASKRYHYKIKYPGGWTVKPGSSSVADQFDGGAYPFVYVSRDVAARGYMFILADTVKGDIAFYKTKATRVEVLSNKAVKVAGWSGRLVIFDGLVGIQRKLSQHLFLVKDRIAYTLDMEGYFSLAAENKALFKKIYSSFKPT
jgi:hypothetical protein